MSYSKLGAHLAIADISNLTFENSKSESRNSKKEQINQARNSALSQIQLAIVMKGTLTILSLRERRTATAAGEGNLGHYQKFKTRQLSLETFGSFEFVRISTSGISDFQLKASWEC
jgi:hypothetical protein